MLSILKLDAGGIPQGWVNPEEATKQYADSSVLWTLGDPIFKMRGGISRATGQQSVIELHSIIAVKGSAKINLSGAGQLKQLRSTTISRKTKQQVTS